MDLDRWRRGLVGQQVRAFSRRIRGCRVEGLGPAGPSVPVSGSESFSFTYQHPERRQISVRSPRRLDLSFPKVRTWLHKITRGYRAPRHMPTSSSWRSVASLQAPLHGLHYLVGAVEAFGGGAPYLLNKLLGSVVALGARGDFLLGSRKVHVGQVLLKGAQI